MLPLSTSTISKSTFRWQRRFLPEKIRSQPRHRGDACRTVQLLPVALLHYDDIAAIQKAFARGQAAVADVQTFATGGADIFMFDTHARCDSPSRNQNTGAEAAPVFSYSRPPVGRGDP
jgi:hypothetical protein